MHFFSFFAFANKSRILFAPTPTYISTKELPAAVITGISSTFSFNKYSIITIYCFPILDPFLYRRVISFGVSTTSSFPQEN